MSAGTGLTTPPADCPRCPRLVEFRHANRTAHPEWHNAPVPAFGGLDARILFIGLAPGLRGANRTGRPFTGDYAGVLLFETLKALGLAEGDYDARADDGFRLKGVRISNAVRCVPPENKPLGMEFAACRPFLISEMAAMPNLAGLFAIGKDAHDQVLTALGLKKSAYAFRHGACHELPNGWVLTDSYHCSRLNTNTGRLTEPMFYDAVQSLVTAIS